jgi:hypothetical protein
MMNVVEAFPYRTFVLGAEVESAKRQAPEKPQKRTRV